MKKTVRGGLAALGIAGAMATGVLTSGAANAITADIGSEGDMSAADYTAELRYANINEFVFQASTLGPWVCSQRASGTSEDGLISYEDGPLTLHNAQQAVATVMGAEFHFCPEFDNPPGHSDGPSTGV